MARLTLLLFALIFISVPFTPCESSGDIDVFKYFGYAGNVLKFSKEIYDGVTTIYNKLQPKTTKESESDIKMESGMEQRITDQIKQLSKNLDSLKTNMQNMKDEIIDKILNELPEQIELKNNLFEIYLRINQIENLYENFVNYVVSPTCFSNGTLLDFAQHATSHDLNELPNVLKTIHWMLIQTDVNAGDSILTILSRSTQAPKQMCKRQQSLQQMLHSLYNAIVVADVKGYIMIQSAYNILNSTKGDYFRGETALAEQQFINRISNTLNAVKKAMSSASREVWACDEFGYKKDVTYTELNNVFQKFVINEADMNVDGSCTRTCPDYKQTKMYGCYDQKICARQRSCYGQLWDCEYKIGSTMWVCPSDRNSSRRYEYIEYGNSQRYGPKGTCKTPSIEMSSWTRGTVACTYCMCTCDDTDYEESDRYISLRETLATINSNYVVTGARLRKDNHILHIQIQEGQLLPGGLIDVNTVRWKPIESYKLHEPLPLTINNPPYTPRENYDYHVLQWKVKRGLNRDDEVMLKNSAFNLDDVDFKDNELKANHLVTGLKFSTNIVYGSGDHISLDLHMSPFNFTTGKVDRRESFWYSLYRLPSGQEKLVRKYFKTEVNVENLDVPTNSGSRAVPTSQTNQYLYLTTSSLETDAGQSTIPFIDLQSVETNPPVPLSGAGVFHKSSPGSGGFLSLKLFTFDYEPHMKAVEN